MVFRKNRCSSNKIPIFSLLVKFIQYTFLSNAGRNESELEHKKKLNNKYE